MGEGFLKLFKSKSDLKHDFEFLACMLLLKLIHLSKKKMLLLKLIHIQAGHVGPIGYE